jgi:TP901 family phage tail tape measure protein
MTQPQGGDQFSLGNAVGYVDINTSGATTALTGLKGQMQSFFQSTASGFQQAGQLATNFGQSLSIAMIPVAGAMATGIQAAGNFQDAMAEIAARTGLTGEALDSIREKALQMGADTSFSAQQAADAFLQLLSSGSSAEEALIQIEPVLRGAEAAGADLAFTADALTDIMAAMGLEASQSVEVMDALIDASGSSSASFEDLAAGFANVGPMAKNMGMSVEEVAATLAVFSENGIKGAEAGTQLRSMLNNMTRDTEDVTGMWNRLGVSMFDANGNARDLNAIIGDLNVAMEGMNDQQRNEVITTLAGTYGQMGLSALLATGGIQEMQGAMATQADFADIAAARMDTFNGLVMSLKGSIESLLITAFTPFIDSLKPGLKLQIQWVNGLTSWVSANQRLVQPMLHLLKILTFVGPALIIIGKVLPLVGMGFAALFSPIGAITVAIALLSAAWAKNLGGIQEKTMYFVGSIRQILGLLFNADYIFQGGFAEDSPLTTYFINIRQAAIETIAPVTRVFNSIRLGWRILNTNLSAGNSVLRSVIQAWTVFATSLGMSWETVLGVNRSLYGLRDAFIGTFQAISTTATNAVRRIPGVFKAIGSVIQGQIENFKSGGIRSVFDTLFDYADRRGSGFDILMAMGFSDDTMSRIDTFLAPVAKAIDDFIVGVQSTFSRVTNALRPLFRELSIFFGNMFGNIDGSQLLQVGHTLMQLTNPIGQISLLLKGLGIDIFPMLMNAFESGVGILTTFFQYMNNGVAPIEALKAALSNPQWLDSVIAGFASIGNFVTGTVIPALHQLGDWFLTSALPGIVSFVTTTVVPATQNFFGILAGAWAQIQPNLGPMGSWLVTFGQQLFTVFGQVAKLLIDFAMVAIPIVAQALTTVIIPAISTFIGWVQNIWTAVAPYLQRFSDWFMTTGLPIALGYARSLYDNVLVPVWTGISNFIDTVVMPALARFADWFIAGALPQIEMAMAVFVMQWDAFKQGIAAIWDFVSPALTSIWNWFTTGGFQEIGVSIANFLAGAWALLTGALSGVWTLVQSGIQMFQTGVTNALNAILTVINNVLTAWNNFRNTISNGIASAQNDIANMQNAWQQGGVGGVINQGTSNIGSFFNQIMGSFATGTNFIPQTGIYELHRGEAVIPAAMNPAAGGTGGGMHMEFHNGAFVIHANSYAEGQQAAMGLEHKLNELLRMK